MTAHPPPIEPPRARLRETMGGTPVFVGTRVPAQTLVDYLEGGDSIDEFLKDFPSVSREQAVAALELGNSLLIAKAATI